MILYLHILNILLAFCACDGTGTKAFIFHDTEDGNLTTATLTNAPREPLPEHFLICSSHNQQQIDTPNTYVSGYVLYDDSDFTNPWFNIKYTNNLIALLNLYEIIFVCIKSSLYEPCTDGGLKYNLSHLFHPQKNKFPFSCQ